ncbi:MAG: hypothetical protein ACRCWP_05000 [Shewanella sp.]
MLRQLHSVRIFVCIFLLVTIGFFASAHAQSTKELLSNPQVDDVYVARVDQFSKLSFGKSSRDKAYGLLRVVAVDDLRIVVVTTQKGWSDARAVFVVLNQNPKNIEWDFNDKIEVLRADLPALEEKEFILEVRRMQSGLGNQ